MEGLIHNISFSKRPIPIPADYRPLYKIAQVTLILKYVCRGNSSRLLKLHLFSWALKSESNMRELMNYIHSNYSTDFSVWGIEPNLNRALHIAVAENICNYADGKYSLSAKGIDLIGLIESDAEILGREKTYLSQMGKNAITDSRLQTMATKWTLFNAEN